MEQHDYIVLLEKFFKKEASSEERRILIEWIRKPGIRDEFNSLCEQMWKEAAVEIDKTVEEEMWSHLQRNLDEPKILYPKKRRWQPIIYKVAATILLPVCLGLATYFGVEHMNKVSQDPFMVAVDYGQKANLTLPDGTKVWLNSATHLSYDAEYNKSDRKIYLDGEAYFEDKIFALSDEQKGLAENYAQNLSVFLGDGMMQGLLPAESAGLVSLGDIRFSDGATQVVYYNQLAKRYAHKPYGTDDIGTYGCGPTCMAMVVSSLTNETVDPVEMARWAYENGYWCSRSGSYHSLIPGAAEGFGLSCESIATDDPQAVVDALASGKLIVALMSKGHFTSSGHFLVLRGVTAEGKILVADPASKKRSEQEWDLSIILDEARRGASAGGPFWAIFKEGTD